MPQIPVDPTGWVKGSDDTIVEFSPTEGILLTVDTHNPPDQWYAGTISPMCPITGDFQFTVRLPAPTGDGAYDLDVVAFLRNREINSNWRWIQFDWYSYLGTAICDARMVAGETNVGISPNPAIDPAITPWWRARVESGTLYWEVSEDGDVFTELGSIPWNGTLITEGEIEVDVYANSESPDDWGDWEEGTPRSAVVKWDYLEVDGNVIFNSVPEVSSPGGEPSYVFDAHIFGRRRCGDREEVRLKVFDREGNRIDLSGSDAHIFGRSHRGDREKVRLKLFDSDGNLIDLPGSYAHIFGHRQRGDREEVRLKLFDHDGNPIDLSAL